MTVDQQAAFVGSSVVATTDGPEDRGAPRVGLVLGAGGVVGQAYQAGVLAALANDLGWDPRDASVIVGTSAGSVTGALLRLGVPADDLAAWAVDAPLSVASEHLHDALDGEHEFPPLSWRDLLRLGRPPTPALLRRALRRPWRIRADVAAMTMLPSGRVDLEGRLGAFDDPARRWPRDLLICATRRDDGHRVVFGRDGSPPASLRQAVAASCAIPGYFRPVRVSGQDYFDGGVHSGTNANVLRDRPLDLVVVLAPMGVAGGWARTPDALVRRSAHRRLVRELEPVRLAGTSVVVFEPSATVLKAMGVNLMADDRSDRVVQAAFFDAGGHAASAAVRPHLQPLVTLRVAA